MEEFPEIRFEVSAPERPERPAAVSVPVEERLFAALAVAETGGEKDPFIRTRVRPKRGSTAYGPVQITRNTAKDLRDRYRKQWSNDEIKYLDRLVEQGDKFAHFGNEPKRAGYDPRYDYGGAGDLTSPADREMYERVARRMIQILYKEQGGNAAKFVERWRGEADPSYSKKVLREFQAISDAVEKSAAPQ